MQPDVLFWFYKNFKICRERLIRIRRFNENIRIYALYGGPLSESNKAKEYIYNLVDDYYMYPYEKDPRWKWRHGDQMIASWYMDRGQFLEWDNIFIMQWDMLVLAPLKRLFGGLKPNEILLSGYRPLSEISSWWPWATSKKSDLILFKNMLNNKLGYKGDLFACLFIVVCLPRLFLQKYIDIGHPEIGFLEYKIPTLAHIFGIPVCKSHDFEPWWAADPSTKNVPVSKRTLNAVGQEVPLSVILRELSKKNGKRLFHPVFRTLPPLMENRYIAYMFSYYFSFLEKLSSYLNI